MQRSTTVMMGVLSLWAIGVGLYFNTAGAANSNSTPTASIVFAGNSIKAQGSGVKVSGARAVITMAGTYRLSGRLANGQLVIDTADAQTVTLLFNGVEIHDSSAAPIEILHAEKVNLVLVSGTSNRLSDISTAAATNTADQQQAATDGALYSHEDLVISGDGSLQIDARRHGIVSKDSVRISAGNISINAAQDGIKARDVVRIGGGVIRINAGSDGLQANHDQDVQQGNVLLEGGQLEVVAGSDAVQASGNLTVSGGLITLLAGGGSSKAVRSNDRGGWGRAPVSNAKATSVKGLKAGAALLIKGGQLKIDAADDALNADDSIRIDGGRLQLAAGGDAMHADKQLQVNSGDIDISRSYEGLESRAIVINGGVVRLVSDDDGINVTSDSQGYGFGFGGRPGSSGGDGSANGSSAQLTVNGGYVYVDALGDGIDVNASMAMTGGTLVVSGPTANMNAALDYDGNFRMTGGLLVAAGSAGMAQAPGSASTQNAVRVTLTAMQAAGTPLHIVSSSDQALMSFTPAKAYQSLVFSSPALRTGETYVVYAGGKLSGSSTDGLYSKAVYVPGQEVGRFTVNSVVSTVGAGGSGFGGMRGGMGRW